MKQEFGVDEQERERWWDIYRNKKGIRPNSIKARIYRLIFIAGWNAAAVMDKKEKL